MGAVIVGFVRSLAVHYWPQVEVFSIYAVMALVLAVRPQGAVFRCGVAQDMMNKTRTFVPIAVGAALILIAMAWALPTWIFVISIGLAKGLVVLGLVLMMRGGLVSFGQGLYYAIGGYSVGLMVNIWKINEAVLLLIAPVVIAAATAAVAGLLCRGTATSSSRC